MRASFTAVAALLAIVVPTLAQTSAPPTKILKVKIEATEHDKQLLLDKLKHHALEHQLECELSDENFHYRIAFEVQYVAIPGQAGGSYASAKAYDSNGKILFDISRDSRVPWGDSDARATDKVAKEIIKVLLKAPHSSLATELPETDSGPH